MICHFLGIGSRLTALRYNDNRASQLVTIMAQIADMKRSTHNAFILFCFITQPVDGYHRLIE